LLKTVTNVEIIGYANTTLVLANLDPHFGTMLQNSQNVTYTDVTSPDGGKTWKIDEIYVKAWYFAPVISPFTLSSPF
jgi:hypothetical protein